MPQHTLTGQRHREEQTREFQLPYTAPSFYEAVRRFHQNVSDSDSTFVVDL